MVRTLLILATVVDLGLGVLLIGVSGFVFGPGPESIRGGGIVAAGWTAMVVFCIAAPIVGFVMNYFRKPVGGILVAWLPPVIALVVAAFQPTY